MAFTPFDMALGTRQGRVAHPAAVSGGHVVVLGSDLPGHLHDLEVGDYTEVQQDVDLSSTDLVRASLRLRNATVLPGGSNWEASILVGGVKHSRMLLAAGRTRSRFDMTANISKLTGVQPVAFRLELVGV